MLRSGPFSDQICRSHKIMSPSSSLVAFTRATVKLRDL